MAFLSEDLFDVFEEKSQPVSLTGKKRKGPINDVRDESKKSRTDAEAGSSYDNPAIIKESQSTSAAPMEVVDLTGPDEEAKE